MCKKSQELEAKIERYRRIAARLDDKRVSAGIARLIEEAEAELAALQPMPGTSGNDPR